MGLGHPNTDLTVTLSPVVSGLLARRANSLLIEAAEHLAVEYALPRWAALVTLQRSLPGALCGGASALRRHDSMRAFMGAATQLASVDYNDAPAREIALETLNRAFHAYLAGALVQ